MKIITSSESKKYLNETDWLVIKHRYQLKKKKKTSLTHNQYLD